MTLNITRAWPVQEFVQYDGENGEELADWITGDSTAAYVGEVGGVLTYTMVVPGESIVVTVHVNETDYVPQSGWTPLSAAEFAQRYETA